ncbi:MAG: magnesium transporter MgtE [Sporomusaceae bacterium]|nr:magnesium transporter MgtE [Sporomusaceae bacterium]
MAEKNNAKNTAKNTAKPTGKTDKKANTMAGGEEIEGAPPKKKRRIFLILFVIFLLLLLLAVGFAIGIYLKLFDVQKTAEDLNLQDKPFIGRFFQKPKTNFDAVDLTPQSPVEPSPGNALTGSPMQPNPVPAVNPAASQVPGQVAPGTQPTAPGVATDQNLAKLAKQRQQEEAKKISKLARLYGNMKPDEAVPILSQLDNPTVVAVLNKMEEEQAGKILAQFEPARAAQISQAMLAVPTVQ